jgi:hypothetical protein
MSWSDNFITKDRLGESGERQTIYRKLLSPANFPQIWREVMARDATPDVQKVFNGLKYPLDQLVI